MCSFNLEYTEANRSNSHNVKSSYTIIVMGTSISARALLLNCLSLIGENATPKGAIDRSERYIDYGTDRFRFVDFPVTDSDLRIATNVMSRLSEYPEIHGITTTIQNNDPELLGKHQSELCFMYNLILRNGFKNCCIVNVVDSLDASTSTASTQLSTFMEQFCKSHEITKVPTNSIIINIGAIKECILNNPLIKVNIKAFRNAMVSVNNDFLHFIEHVKTVPPIVASHLLLAAKIRRLETLLINRCENPSFQVRRLMATVKQYSLTDFAAFCRNNVSNNITAVREGEWMGVIDYWRSVNGRITAILEDIVFLLHGRKRQS